MNLRQYLRIWLARLRYSLVRTMMFRCDFFLWSLVELFWMSVNVLMVEVIYRHTDSVAGWSKYEMLLLVGTSMLIQRLLMGFFWSNLFEMGRNVRTGHFDFYPRPARQPALHGVDAQARPGRPRQLVVAAAVICYAAHASACIPASPASCSTSRWSPAAS